ncbi:MAG TPA: glycosyltransferase family 1 protein [Pyrinomonadaceae bacterium]|jgi:glycosyltransferase involved in cell wall biosynthesis|nr:glycosyltransferase family 1 protein [Pyrinomonadaceae bacterium]
MGEAGKLRVCIDARILSGTLGGVEQFVIGLAHGLSQLRDGDEEYLLLALPGEDDWLKPYVGGACRLLHGTGATRRPAWARGLNVPPLARAVARRILSPVVDRRAADELSLPHSDGTAERAGARLMHFPTQGAFLTELPSIYHPWDLQHLHLPQFFTPEAIRARERSYRAYCERASMVAVASAWHARDVARHYGLPEGKVRVVPAAPVLSAYAPPTEGDLRAAREKFLLPENFIFYPAQTWAHKNHLALLDALAHLRDREGLRVPLVSSGKLNDFYPRIEGRARELGLADQVRFLGFVSTAELQSLYRLCRLVVFPTKFEGFGMPLMEAFLAGAPVASSNVTSLPEQAGDAALLFDPDDAGEIASAVSRLWTDDALRGALARRGRARVSLFTYERTARLFRAHYRRLAARELSEEDRALLAAPPPA